MDNVFFFASKLVWGIMRPDVILLILLVWGVFRLWRGRIRGAKWCLTLAMLGYLAVTFTPIAHVVLYPLESRFPVDPHVTDPAGIIVLGGSERSQQSERWGVPLVNEGAERFLAAIALARKYPDAKLLFTGGSGSVQRGAPSESLVANRIFREAGITADRIVLEGKSRNTAENVAFSLEIIGDPGTRPWILVTSAFHMPRAVGVFCAAGWPNIVPYPTDFRSGLPGREMEMRFDDNIENLNRGSKEWVGLLAYWLTGRSASLFPEGCAT